MGVESVFCLELVIWLVYQESSKTYTSIFSKIAGYFATEPWYILTMERTKHLESIKNDFSNVSVGSRLYDPKTGHKMTVHKLPPEKLSYLDKHGECWTGRREFYLQYKIVKG